MHFTMEGLSPILLSPNGVFISEENTSHAACSARPLSAEGLVFIYKDSFCLQHLMILTGKTTKTTQHNTNSSYYFKSLTFKTAEHQL